MIKPYPTKIQLLLVKVLSSIFHIYNCNWFGFYGISTIVGYLMPSPVFTYILNIRFVNIFLDTQLNDQTVQFLRIQFSISQQS